MKTISAEELDRMFDEGEDISEFIDFSTARKVNGPVQLQVNASGSEQMAGDLDAEAQRMDVIRQHL